MQRPREQTHPRARVRAPRFKRVLAASIRPLPIPWKVKRSLRFEGRLRIDVDGSHSFVLDTLGGWIETDLYFRGYGQGWEGYSLRVWNALVPQARVIVDAGAAFGVYSLAAASLNPEATIIAFEPFERSYQQLVANIALNGFVIQAEPVALSDIAGDAVLYVKAGRVRRATLTQPASDGTEIVERSVTTIRLDDYWRAHGMGAIDLLKMDIEGSEPAALRGMASLIETSRPAILIEILTGDAGHMIWSQVGPHGYDAYRVDERRGLIPAETLGAKSGRSRNYLLCRPDVFRAARLDRFLAT